MARLGAIDIGSNAIRLRIVDVDPPQMGPDGPRFYAFREVQADRAPVRLGHDVFTRGEIEPSVIAAACDALRRFRATMDAAKVDRYRAVATSAAREAQNGDRFVERAEREAGVHVEIIEGVEEARLVQLAVLERLSLGDREALLIDIGGGSTELTLLRDRAAVFSRSLPVGTVRMLEAFLDTGGSTVDRPHRHLLEEYVDRVCADAVREIQEIMGNRVAYLIGTGGNVETLADLCPLPSAFPEGRAIEVGALPRLLDELSARTVEERVALYGFRPDRADTIVPAATILHRVASTVGAAGVSAPGVGLKEGVLVDLARAHFFPPDVGVELAAITDACVRLGRRYHFDERHGARVARFATRLFDDLSSRHKLAPRDRILLHAAALLHDVGDFVRYEGHHKHSQYIITHSDLMGLTPAERDLVANVARYHRKSLPTLDHETFRVLTPRDRAKVREMAAILRIADALDREHRGKVTEVAARLLGQELVLSLSGSDERELEEWTVLAKSNLLREAFGLEVRIEAAGWGSGRASRPGITRPPRA
jgi:exopolyphosphatase/guanosine-5'-triphosphate,3'-diphosphate pyrophosphatase